MRRKDTTDIIIIIGPDKPGDNTTQRYIDDKLTPAIARCKEQGLSCKVIGNGKDPISAADMASLPLAQCVIMCGHGKGLESHQIKLHEDYSDTNSLIENIQTQTGAKQFILASCYSGKVHETLAEGKQSLKEGTEIIALSPPDAKTSMYFALDSVAQAIDEIGTNKSANNTNDSSKLYADLLQTSPNAMSYGVQTDNGFVTYDFDPKTLLYFSDKDSDFIADSRNDGINHFKLFLEDNNRPPLPDQSTSKYADINRYSRDLLNDFIYRADVDSISKIVEKCPMVMSRATVNVYDYVHEMKGMRSWAKDDRKYMGMLKQLVHYDLDHNAATNFKDLLADIKSNKLPPTNKVYLKSALFDMAIDTKDANKQNYLINSLLWADGNRIFEGMDPQRVQLLSSKMTPEQLEIAHGSGMKNESTATNNNSSAKIMSSLGITSKDVLANSNATTADITSSASNTESKSNEPKPTTPEVEKREEHSNNNNNNNNNNDSNNDSTTQTGLKR